MIELNKSGVELVRADENGNSIHEYRKIENRQETFVGITGYIRDMLRPDEYNNVPESILEKARIKGDLVHRECELLNSGIDIANATPEAQAYIKLINEQGLEAIESEFVVTDNDFFATSIDVVLQDKANGTIVLGDYKTTYNLDVPYLTAQLNVMKYLFELQTGRRVSKLVAFWLRPDHAEMREIEKMDSNEVMHMLKAWKYNEQYIVPIILRDAKPIPTELESEASMLPIIDEMIKVYKNASDTIKARIFDAMQEQKADKWECGGAKFSITHGGTRRSIDNEALNAKYPDVVADASIWKETTTKDSIRATYKKAK